MRDAIDMWREPRMVVLSGVCAAVYAAAMIPFKVLVVFPGFAEVRPAAVLPVIFSFLFGPAGAFGAAFGNLVGDMLGGMFGLGSIPGFLANFAYGYLPYKIWRAFGGGDVGAAMADWRARLPGWAGRPAVLIGLLAAIFMGSAAALFALQRAGALDLASLISYNWGKGKMAAGPVATVIVLAMVSTVVIGSLAWLAYAPVRYVAAVAGGCLGCAGILAYGIDLFGFVPFAVFGPWILAQNLVLGLTLGPPLLLLVYPRVEKRFMRFADIMPDQRTEVSTGWAWFTVAMLAVLVAAGIAIGPEWLGRLTGLGETAAIVKKAGLGAVTLAAALGIAKL